MRSRCAAYELPRIPASDSTALTSKVIVVRPHVRVAPGGGGGSGGGGDGGAGGVCVNVQTWCSAPPTVPSHGCCASPCLQQPTSPTPQKAVLQ